MNNENMNDYLDSISQSLIAINYNVLWGCIALVIMALCMIFTSVGLLIK